MSSFRRKRLSTTEREQLYDGARGDRLHPVCPRCKLPVFPTDRWHAGHELSPLLGGRNVADQVEHALCNQKFAAEVEAPLIAHNKRVRQRFIGAFRTRYPMPGGRDDPRKRRIDGKVVFRNPSGPGGRS
jgi:hypothetical protein